MKRTLALSLISCALIAACQNPEAHHRRIRHHQFGGEPLAPDQTYVEQTTTEETNAPEERPRPTPTPAPETAQPTPTPAPVVTHEAARTGIPVPGKPGYIRSPYSPNSGLIDVRGYPTGTEVRDPYTVGKIILVP